MIKTSVDMLQAGSVPERYQRNIGTVGLAGQIRLLESRVAVVGAGGLGGMVVELLARMGVGYLRVIDGDCFAAHNLNRQLLATENNIGENKAQAAVRRVAAVNSEITVEAVPCLLDESNAVRLLDGMHVVVDALDNFSARILLSRVAAQLGIPMVHAAIAGFVGQVMTIFPGDKGLEQLYQRFPESDRGIEAVLGNPAATPAFAAGLEVQEVVKIITGIGEPIRNKLLFFDTQFNVFEFLDINTDKT
ncbi:MAG: HesA/MoeB/ThiF family protein [Negativicutes bacterium]|nr:HesA/MoeB/ThiF family protein [Negativicutes bacterium]